MITYLWSLDCEMSESEIEILLAAIGCYISSNCIKPRVRMEATNHCYSVRYVYYGSDASTL